LLIEGQGTVSEQGTIDPNAEPPAILQPQQPTPQPQTSATRRTFGAVPYEEGISALSKYENNISAIYKARDILENSSRAAGQVPELIKSLGSAPVEALFLQPQRNLNAVIEPLEANLAFDRLELMRRRSKTGGALGNVSDRELALLKSTVASLSNLQDPELILDALQKIENHYTNFLAIELGAESNLPVRLNTNLPTYQDVKVLDGRIYFREINEDGEEAWYTEEPIAELKIESIN
jgi:hypothetical protein